MQRGTRFKQSNLAELETRRGTRGYADTTSPEGYAGGESEISMGKAIKKYGWKRNDLVISTKLNWGAAFGDNPVNNGGLSRKHLIEGMNASLKRLDLEYVDLIYAHRPDRQTPLEETVRAFNHIIETGKALYWVCWVKYTRQDFAHAISRVHQSGRLKRSLPLLVLLTDST
jgi:aryl-alcohol dehydrogenase-like predicted oxidoreductase